MILQDFIAVGHHVDLVVSPDRAEMVKEAFEKASIPYEVRTTDMAK